MCPPSMEDEVMITEDCKADKSVEASETILWLEEDIFPSEDMDISTADDTVFTDKSGEPTKKPAYDEVIVRTIYLVPPSETKSLI